MYNFSPLSGFNLVSYYMMLNGQAEAIDYSMAYYIESMYI